MNWLTLVTTTTNGLVEVTNHVDMKSVQHALNEMKDKSVFCFSVYSTYVKDEDAEWLKSWDGVSKEKEVANES